MPRVILITGTRKGIGRDLSEYYLNKGDIVCGCSRTQSNLEHKNYRHFTLDVSDENAVVNMVRAVKKEFGTIDVLLNNAGIASMNHILTTPLKTMQNIFNTNVFGSFLFLREVSKVMVQNYKKRIKDLESKGLDSKNNAKNAIAEAVCDDFKESAILDSNNKDSTAEGFLSDFSGFTKESIAFGAKGEGSLLNINDRALSEQSAKSTKKPTQTTQMP
ncbi:SDR family NAD(P)-dependent oxidoreductase, partial [Helicobacter cinaedi]